MVHIKTRSTPPPSPSPCATPSDSDPERPVDQLERPPADGSEDPGLPDDPELQELANLRCTSESAEVVAAREARRRQRRCADYPGLAFGTSMFSSDTMMKFSVIRNELQNIMNQQLKRVSSASRRAKATHGGAG